MKDRIKQLMESQHMTQQSFSDFIGISSASLSSIFNGRTKPTLNTVEAIRSKFTKISLDWLMFGKGPMFTDMDISSANPNELSQQPASGNLFDFDNVGAPPSASPQTTRPTTSLPRQHTSAQSFGNGSNTLQSSSRYDLNFIDKPQRRITEIRIFFDDQTWETFVPKK